MNLDRRALLKVLGLSVSATAVPGCKREAHNLVPFLLPDEEIVPGVANWYASLCRECEAGCGTLVRVFEGRAKKMEGNPEHPLNQGKLCARGQASLQALYNPDRIRTPLKRVGERGQGRFESISWESALNAWIEILQRHQGSAFVGRPRPGSEAVLLDRFMQAVGGRAVFYTPDESVVVRAATRASFGVDSLPSYDLGHCDYLLSLGAPFLEHWLSPVSLGIGYGEMRQGRPFTRGRFVHLEPRLSVTAANADRWLPNRPGTELMILVALIRLRLERRPTDSGEVRRWLAWLPHLSVADIADASDVAEEELYRIDGELERAAAPLVLAGGAATAHTNGSLVLQAAHALNYLLGTVNRPGGLRCVRPVDLPAGPQAVAERALLDEIARVQQAGGALHVHEVDPVYLLPPSTGIRDRLRALPALVSFGPFLDDTALMADLILPVNTALESWGDHVYAGEAGRPAAGLQQPVVETLYETAACGDLVLEAARRLGHGRDFPWPTFHAFLREQWQRYAADDPAWIRFVQQGGWWEKEPTLLPIHFSMPPAYETPTFDGGPEDFPFFFHAYPSLSLNRGEGANKPWLQQLPDPLTTAVWGTWIEMNPRTAQELELHDGQMAKVVSPHGEVEAPILHHPGLRPDLIAMPLGQGHEAYGRYARTRGANPLILLGPHFDAQSGRLASAATRVRVEPSFKTGRIVRLEHRATEESHQFISIERRPKV